MFALPPPIAQPPARYMQGPDAPSIVLRVDVGKIDEACTLASVGARARWEGNYGLRNIDPQFLGCAWRRPGGQICTIVVPTLATWHGTAAALVYLIRHEQGHCNGWPEDHPK